MVPALPSNLPRFHPIAPRLAPQQLYFGQGTPGLIPPQAAGYGFQQQLLPGIQPGVGPNYIMPYPIQRQGQTGQRLGIRRGGASQQISHQQLVQRNGNQGFRFMQNARNGVDSSMIHQGLMGPMIPLPLDASGVPVASTPQTQPIPITALASALASATPDNQLVMLGEQLLPLVERLKHDFAGKVTGMPLEMDQTEVLHLIESPDALKKKVNEAMEVLRLSQDDQLGSISLNN